MAKVKSSEEVMRQLLKMAMSHLDSLGDHDLGLTILEALDHYETTDMERLVEWLKDAPTLFDRFLGVGQFYNHVLKHIADTFGVGGKC